MVGRVAGGAVDQFLLDSVTTDKANCVDGLDLCLLFDEINALGSSHYGLVKEVQRQADKLVELNRVSYRFWLGDDQPAIVKVNVDDRGLAKAS